MSDYDIYDDDFHSDHEEASPRGSPRSARRKSQSPLMPIIEVPSEGTESARTSEAISPRDDMYVQWTKLVMCGYQLTV